MQSRGVYSVHTACAVAMFLLSGSVIILPRRGADELTLVGFAVAAIAAVAVSVVALPLVVKLFSLEPTGRAARGCRNVLYVITCLFAAAVAANGFGTFVGFVGDIMLPHTAKILVAALFFVAAILPSVGDKGIVMKFSLFAFLITAAVVVFFLAASLSELRLENVSLLRFPEPMGVVKQALPYFLRLTAALAIIYIYVGVFFKKEKNRAAICGAVVGCAVLGLCLVNVLLLFGAPLAAELDYPYTSAVSTVSLGELFTRMDGLSYFVYFAAQTVQTAICVSLIRELLSRIGEKNPRKTAAFFLAIILLVGCILG